jgi:hypothetical protein
VEDPETRKIHQSIDLVGLRAQATAVGLIQLTVELVRAKVIDEDAVGRIKDAIFRDIALARPASVKKEEFDTNIKRRLDALFSGSEPVGKHPTGGATEKAK